MKYSFFLISFFIVSNMLRAQDKIPALDKSPVDISYCPANYPVSRLSGNTTDQLIARVIYSRPSMNGRKIFSELIPYGKIWRTGANESTEIEFFKEVVIGGKKIKKGRYTLYTIPAEKKWTYVINKEIYSWGAFTYDSTKDIVRVEVQAETIAEPVENLTLYFEKLNTSNFGLITIWENTKTMLPVSLVK